MPKITSDFKVPIDWTTDKNKKHKQAILTNVKLIQNVWKKGMIFPFEIKVIGESLLDAVKKKGDDGAKLEAVTIHMYVNTEQKWYRFETQIDNTPDDSYGGDFNTISWFKTPNWLEGNRRTKKIEKAHRDRAFDSAGEYEYNQKNKFQNTKNTLALSTVFSTTEENVPGTLYSMEKYIPLHGETLQKSIGTLKQQAEEWTVLDVTQAIHAKPRNIWHKKSRVMLRIQVSGLTSHRFSVQLENQTTILNLKL